MGEMLCAGMALQYLEEELLKALLCLCCSVWWLQSFTEGNFPLCKEKSLYGKLVLGLV